MKGISKVYPKIQIFGDLEKTCNFIFEKIKIKIKIHL